MAAVPAACRAGADRLFDRRRPARPGSGCWRRGQLAGGTRYGEYLTAYPDQHADVRRLQAIWVPFAWTDLAPQFFVHADVTSAGKPAHHRYSLAY